MTSCDVTRRKAALRQICWRRRREFTASHVQRAAAAVCARVLDLPEYGAAERIHVYLSSLENELDTHGIVAASWARGKAVVVPVVRPGSRILSHALIAPDEPLAPDRWGLLSPFPESARWLTDLSCLDLLLVPGLAFDGHGHRLGTGGGYYDRFLPATAGVRVGLTYDELLLDAIPYESHDTPMDLVVCPRGVLRCSHG